MAKSPSLLENIIVTAILSGLIVGTIACFFVANSAPSKGFNELYSDSMSPHSTYVTLSAVTGELNDITTAYETDHNKVIYQKSLKKVRQEFNKVKGLQDKKVYSVKGINRVGYETQGTRFNVVDKTISNMESATSEKQAKAALNNGVNKISSRFNNMSTFMLSFL